MSTVDMEDWLQNKAEELSLEQTGHELRELGPHLQVMLWMAAEEAWVDYYSSLADSIYEREKYRRLLG